MHAHSQQEFDALLCPLLMHMSFSPQTDDGGAGVAKKSGAGWGHICLCCQIHSDPASLSKDIDSRPAPGEQETLRDKCN